MSRHFFVGCVVGLLLFAVTYGVFRAMMVFGLSP